MAMEYFENINKSLTILIKLIKKNMTFTGAPVETDMLRKSIMDMMILVRECEKSDVFTTLNKEEMYFVAKTIGRLESVYSIIYPKRFE